MDGLGSLEMHVVLSWVFSRAEVNVESRARAAEGVMEFVINLVINLLSKWPLTVMKCRWEK